MELKRLKELAGISVFEAESNVDANATRAEAQKIEAAIKKALNVPVDLDYGRDGSITVTVNRGNLSTDASHDSDAYGGVATPKRLSAVIDPFFKKFRNAGWTFTQPVKGKFTVAVTK